MHNPMPIDDNLKDMEDLWFACEVSDGLEQLHYSRLFEKRMHEFLNWQFGHGGNLIAVVQTEIIL